MIYALPLPLKLLFSAAFVVLYYGYCRRWLFAAAQRMAQRIGGRGRYDRGEVAGVLKLAAAALSHLVATVVLIVLTGVPLGLVHLGSTPILLVALGVLVGIGEMALASFLCRVIIEGSLLLDRFRIGRVATGSAPAIGGPTTVKGWLAVSRGGWMRHHVTTLEVLPLPATALVVTLQVGSEEIVFRGVFLQLFRPSGFALAFVASLTLYVAIQVFFMASWRAAVFPVVGALVMGVVHGLLVWQVPYLLPLVVAHVVFVLFAVV